MSLASVSKRETALLLPTYERYPVLLRRGKGVYLYDSLGRKYLDFLSGIGVNALGYGHPAIGKALAHQAARLIHVSNLFYHDYQAELAARLATVSGLDRAFFCNSGTEAWEGALKIARAYARFSNSNGHKAKWRILAMENSFHGRTFGSLATTGQPKYRKPFAPLMPGVEFVRFNDVAQLEKTFDGRFCAIALEVVQGEGGVLPASKEFLRAARALTRKTGALLIVDEIQSGLGRTGRYFAYQHYDVLPDVVTVAKPLAAGLPLGAILTTHAVSRCFHPGMHGSTFGGGPLACAVAIAFLETLEKEKLVDAARETGSYLRERAVRLQQKHDCIRDVRALGLMVGVELSSGDLAKSVVKEMLKRGIIINRTNENTLRFLPPFIITEKHIDRVITELDSVLAAEAMKTRPEKINASRGQGK